MIKDQSISFIYCWDAAVHFEKSIMKSYIAEFSRILRPGGKGFVHHSDLGDAADSDILKNPSWRSNVNKKLFREYCEEAGLKVVNQVALPWGQIKDCISVFQK